MRHAAQQVCGGAASARFAPRSVDAGPVDLSARRDTSSDNSDAERWLDERGSSSTNQNLNSGHLAPVLLAPPRVGVAGVVESCGCVTSGGT